MNTHGEHELELAANRAEPENQAELILGPNPDKTKIKFFFSKNHIRKKGQPDSST